MVNAREAAEAEHRLDQLEAVFRAELRSKLEQMDRKDLENLVVNAAELINYVSEHVAGLPVELMAYKSSVILFGIFNGWDDDRWAGIQMRYNLPLARVRRLQRYHATVERLIK